MNQRVKNLRDQTITAKPYISPERAILLTKFYQSGIPDRTSVPVTRALAFKYLLEKKSICINNGELIVGERGPEPKATPTYPELCTHSIKDLDILYHCRQRDCPDSRPGRGQPGRYSVYVFADSAGYSYCLAN